MHQYDTTLKLLLRGSAALTIRKLAGAGIQKWLDHELPKVQNLRMDLLGQTASGGLIHLELQSTNDPAMPLRMAEYCLGILRSCGKFPRQILLYVGKAPMRMEKSLRGPDLKFRYRALDIRSLDGDRLLESSHVGDHVIAILARLRDHRVAVRRIVQSIASLAPAVRATALTQLMLIAGLRDLEQTIEEEARKVPVFIDILENKVLGREYKRGREEGRLEGHEEGRLEGREEGRREGELRIVRRLIEKRFGVLPLWAEERLQVQSTSELEELGDRVLTAHSLNDLLKQ